MMDEAKTKAQLLDEVMALRHQVADLQAVIAAHEHAKEVLHDGEQCYRIISEMISDYAYAVRVQPDWTYTVEWFTKTFTRVTGFTLEKGPHSRDTWKMFIHPDDLSIAYERGQKLMAGQADVREFRIVTKSGEVRWVHEYGHPVWDETQGRVTQLYIAGWDITDRKWIEQALRESEARVRTVVSGAPIILFAVDREGVCTLLEGRALETLGLKPGEVVGRSIFDVYRDIPLIKENIQRALTGEEFIAIVEIGGVVFETRYAPLRGQSGEVTGVIGVATDITARTEAERALHTAKEAAEAANRAKSEFLATMSHELRTPLAVILGCTSLFMDGTVGSLEGEQGDFLRRIDRNALELLELITAVLDLSRLEAGRLLVELRAVQVSELVKELEAEIREVREHLQLEFAWQVEAELLLIQTDPGKLKVVLKNLIRNAIKFTKEGRITVAARDHRDGIEVRVIDTGIGLPQEALELIFEPFRQLENTTTHQYGGTGLGLYIVKRLLEMLGGMITVESEVGRGSTFSVWIPKKRTEQRNSAETSAALRERGLKALRH